MQVSTGGSHTHHHGLLAGVGAGAAGVLAGTVILFAAWSQISHAVGTAGTVLVWTLTAGVVAFVAFEIAVRVLRLRHHIVHPETLVPQVVRAEVIPGHAGPAAIAGAPAALPASPAGALEPPRREVHYHFNTAEAVFAARRVMGTAEPSEGIER